jgi:hypothetical protein
MDNRYLPDVFVMQPAKDWEGDNAATPLAAVRVALAHPPRLGSPAVGREIALM